MDKIPKTNAMRILDRKGINYEIRTFPVDDEHIDGITVSGLINADADSVFKTLVAKGPKTGVNIFCLPVTAELDVKKALSAAGDKSIEMVSLNNLFNLTGYVRGGCSPIAMKKNYPVYIDETVQLFDKIFISAGKRGVQMGLAYEDLIDAADGVLADITKQ